MALSQQQLCPQLGGGGSLNPPELGHGESPARGHPCHLGSDTTSQQGCSELKGSRGTL